MNGQEGVKQAVALLQGPKQSLLAVSKLQRYYNKALPLLTFIFPLMMY